MNIEQSPPIICNFPEILFQFNKNIMQKFTFQRYENKKTLGDYIEITATIVTENNNIIVKISGSLLAIFDAEKYANRDYGSIIQDHEKNILEMVEKKYKEMPECTEILISNNDHKD